MTIQVTRRALLAVIPGSAVSVTASPLAAASTVDRSVWEAAMERYLAQKREYDSATVRVLSLYAEQTRARASIPHRVFRADSRSGRHIQVSTADADYVRSAQRLVRDVDAGRTQIAKTPNLQGYVALCRELTVAVAERDAAFAAIRERLGLRVAEQNRQRLREAMIASEDALLKLEAPDIGALGWKLDSLLAEQGKGNSPKLPPEVIEQTRTEIAKFIGRESGGVGFFDRFKSWFW